MKLAGSIQEHFKFSLHGVEAVAARLIAANERLGVISQEQERAAADASRKSKRKLAPLTPNKALSCRDLTASTAEDSRPSGKGFPRPAGAASKRVAAVRKAIYRKACGE